VQIGAVRIGLRCGLGINADEFILPEKLFLVMFKYVLFGFVVFLTSCTTKDNLQKVIVQREEKSLNGLRNNFKIYTNKKRFYPQVA